MHAPPGPRRTLTRTSGCIAGLAFCLLQLAGDGAVSRAVEPAPRRSLVLAPIESLGISAPVERISLAQAFEEARRNGPGPTLARAALAEAEAAHSRTFEQLLPGFSVEGVRRHTDGAVQATLGDIQDADFSTIQIEGSLHYDLRLGNFRAEQAAQLRASAAESDSADSERAAQETVVAHYFDIQRSRARLAAAQTSAREAEELAEAERARFESGQRLRADWLRQRARAAESRLLVAESQLATRLASIRLSRTLGRDPSVLLLPADDVLATPEPQRDASVARDADQGEIAELLAAAERERPDLVAARMRLDAEVRDAAQARDAALWPTLTFDVRRGLLGRNPDDAQARTVYGAWLRWDFFDTRGGAVGSRRAEANAHQVRRSAELEHLRRQVRGEVLEALARTRIARASLEAAEEALLASEEAFEVRKVRAQSGLESGLELLDAEKDLARARFDEADALTDLTIAGLRMKLVVSARL